LYRNDLVCAFLAPNAIFCDYFGQTFEKRPKNGHFWPFFGHFRRFWSFLNTKFIDFITENHHFLCNTTRTPPNWLKTWENDLYSLIIDIKCKYSNYFTFFDIFLLQTLEEV